MSIGASEATGMPLLLVIVCATIVPACSREDGSGAVRVGSSQPSATPIGERCLDCHEKLVRAYRETGMARALESIRAGELEGLRPVTDAAGWTYRLEKGERAARIVETWKSGEKAIAADLAFAVGAGLMDRSYAAAVGDLLWFTPLEVLTDGNGRHAALAPGHAIHPGMRFTSPIAEECLACHTDRLPPRDYPLNLRPDPAAWQPSGISCAACHGDVDGHAQWREAESAGAKRDEKDPILAASRAGWVESVSICARCHLQGDASFLLEPRARGVLPPGGDMLEKRAAFVAAAASDEIRFVSHVERLVLSPCFTGSLEAGREPLTCVTCHDPHRSSFDPKERKVVRNACSSCHTTTEMPCSEPAERRDADDCAQCHMRRTGVFDLDHVEIHDHFIRRDPGLPSPPAELRVHESKDGKLALFAWPGRERRPYADDPGLWMMAEMAAGHPELALPFADREPGTASARLPTYHHLRGSLLEGASRLEEARSAYERALALDPAQAETAVNLGLLLGRLGKAREGIAALDAVVSAHPKAAPALRNRAVLKLQLGDRGGFAADLETAFAIAPSAALAKALADHARNSGRSGDADRWVRAARELDPSRPEGASGAR